MSDDVTSTDGAAIQQQDAAKEQKPAWSDEQQAEFDRRAAALKKAAAAEARQKAIAEFEAKQAADKDAAEKARLADEGKFKEVAEKADLAKSAAEKRAEEAEQKAKALALQIGFDRAVMSMGIEFADTLAAEDAFAHLDMAVVGEDGAGMKKAIEQLQASRPYYFGSQKQSANTDASQRGKRQTNQKSEEEARQEIIARYNIRKPR